jgi:A/G-specific adenine glycosylase
VLPWRELRSPYAVLVSEFMLQQTQVTRVVDFYQRFLGRYPTLEALAAAEPAAVRESWDGLGYYARARNLHAAARRIVGELGGAVPRTPEELERLPGIGRYTAGAVASIAFGARVAAVDTNAERVLARVFAVRGQKGAAGRTRRLWALGTALVAAGRSGDVNQALMDLGATVCTARAPHCVGCPLRGVCRSRRRAANAALR